MDRFQNAGPIGVGFIGIGFLVIFIAWNGAAAKDCAQCQIPYLISGGATGIGLIVIGCSLMLFEAARRDRAHADARFHDMIEALKGTTVPSPSLVEPDAPTGAVPAIPSNGNTVVVGRSSFHRTDCRLVEGKEDLTYTTRTDAEDQGLEPCRVCDPTSPDITAGKGKQKKKS
ncbi:MAG: hypothetical protein ACLGH3_04000 [Actinomycetota bacterium]